ncbi:MAG: hypothetical protein IKU64_07575 [Bacteroides sp.]|nr:hypothetical protein [Bacteroides sp.]
MMNNIESRELQEMKEQLAILTQKLEKEAIVNERLIRQSMKDKASSISRKAITESIVTLIMLPFYIWVMPGLVGVSVGLCCYACFFMVAVLIYNYYIHNLFRPEKFINGNLLEARKDTLTAKKLYNKWIMYIGIPFCIVFIGWFTHDISQVLRGEMLQRALTGLIIGCTIGGIIGIFIYKKAQRTMNEILEQIKEMQI